MTFDAINDKSNHIQHICNCHIAWYEMYMPRTALYIPSLPYPTLQQITLNWSQRKFAFENNFISENYATFNYRIPYQTCACEFDANEIGGLSLCVLFLTHQKKKKRWTIEFKICIGLTVGIRFCGKQIGIICLLFAKATARSRWFKFGAFKRLSLVSAGMNRNSYRNDWRNLNVGARKCTQSHSNNSIGE